MASNRRARARWQKWWRWNQKAVYLPDFATASATMANLRVYRNRNHRWRNDAKMTVRSITDGSSG